MLFPLLQVQAVPLQGRREEPAPRTRQLPARGSGILMNKRRNILVELREEEKAIDVVFRVDMMYFTNLYFFLVFETNSLFLCSL